MILNHHCVLKLHNIHPKFLRSIEIKQGEEDHLDTLGVEDGDWYFYRKLKRELAPSDVERLKRKTHTSTDTGIEISGCFVKFRIPNRQADFYRKINSLPGCRLAPIALQHQGDVYISLEFDKTISNRVNNLVSEYLSSPLPYKRSIAYLGVRTDNFPILLKMYSSFGNSLEKFTVIRSEWDFQEDEQVLENQGIFQNIGEIILKQFTNEVSGTLIWKMVSAKIAGNAKAVVVDPESKVIEIEVKTSFFADFFKTVLKEYSGGVFYSAKCEDSKLINYFIIDQDPDKLFTQKILSHWGLGARKHHSNHLLTSQKLEIPWNEEQFPG